MLTLILILLIVILVFPKWEQDKDFFAHCQTAIKLQRHEIIQKNVFST